MASAWHDEITRAKIDQEQTADWIAHNMVAWFSLDRRKIDGKWAYRPRTT